MKLFINARFLTQPISGVQRYAIECSRQIKKIYPESVFLSPGNIIHEDIAKELGALVIGKNTGHKWEQIDLLFYLIRNGGAPLLSLANTAPLFYTNNYIVIHDLAFYHHPEWNSKQFAMWYNILIPRLARSSRHIFTVSQTIKNEIIKYYKEPASKITVTYNGLSKGFTERSSEGIVQKDAIILMVGTFNKRKNQQQLLKAFLECGIRNKYQLVFVGDKNKAFSESGIDEKELHNDHIKVYEHPDNKVLRSLYEKAEIVVSLSEYEGFGIPVLEGLFFGCKVLCSDIPVYRELFDGYVTYCDPHNINGIGKALEKVSEQKGNFGQEGINLLLEKYNYEKSAETIVSIINAASKGKK